MAQLDWKAEYAYTTGMQAFIYGFPYMYNAQLRHDWVTNKRDPDVVPYAAVDHLWHAARRPLRAAFHRRQPAPGRRILVPGRLHHTRHEPDPQRR